MIEDRVQDVFELARARMPIGSVAMWAVIGVVAAVILIRLRQDHIGVPVGAALIALGGTALILLCTSLGAGTSRQTVIVLGTVVPGSISKRPGTDEYRFAIEGLPGPPRAVISARYLGQLPDGVERNAYIAWQGTLVDGGRLLDVDGMIRACRAGSSR